MKRSNKLLRLLFGAASVLSAVTLTLGGCTSVDDTLGGNLVPDNQQMRAGFVRFPESGEDKAKYVTTRLFQSDSVVSSNLSSGYFGSQLNDTLGLRTAGFLTQMINLSEIKEGYFGYKPIFDSAQLLISIASYGRDTLTEQRFAVYEVKSNKYITDKPAAAGKSERDTTFYLNFDPVKEGVIDETEGPLFYFTLGGEDKGPATTAVTLEPTESGREYIQRLMLQQGDYKDDYSIYSIDSLEQWVEEFRGFYICPDPAMPLTADRGEGTIFGTTLESSGFAVYGRNRVEADPSLIQDTLQMLYYFYEGSVDHGNVSVNTIRRDYGMATSTDAKFDIADAKETSEPITSHPTYDQIYVEGMGGVVTAITFDKPFFDALEAEIVAGNEGAQNFKTLAMTQVRMSIYFKGSNYDWTKLTDMAHMIEEMDKSQTRLGLYTNYKTLSAIPDYAYAYEQNYSTTLAYGGYINRSRGCYVMDITGYAQSLWNSYQSAKAELGADAPWDELKEKIKNRTIYLGPEAYSVYTTTYSVLQGMTPDGVTEEDVPIKIDVTYNLIK